MYLDNTHVNRSTWKFTYTGEEMVNHTLVKLDEMCQKEKNAREEVIRITRDPNTNPSDRKVEEAKRACVAAATMVEELSVYYHEFRKNPNREYHLSAGDVVFLGLISEDIQKMVHQKITPSN